MSVSAGSLLKHCFYDKGLFEKYVKQGKGVGFLVLLIAAALTAVVFCVKVAWIFANIPESDISRFCEQFPEMAVSGGEIISETPIVQTLPALVPHILLAVDTKANEQDAVNFPAGVYLMKRALTIVDTNRQVQKIPLKNIFGEKPLKITPENAHAFLTEFIPYIKKTIPVAFFIVTTPVFFIRLILTAYLLSFISFALSMGLNVTLSFEERLRLAVLSLLPAALYSLVLNIFSYRFFGGFTTVVLISLAYMLFFMWPVAPDEKKNADK